MPSYLDNLFGLHGRTAIVTGAAQGNGLAIAKALLRAGAEVLLVDKDDELKEKVRAFRKARLKASPLYADLSTVSGLLDITHDRQCDILVNNAGVSLPSPKWSAKQLMDTMAVNFFAPFDICKRLLPGMAKRKRGSIINITSLNDRLAFPDNVAYMTSKAALGALTRSIALDYGPYGVRCNNLVPGYVRSNMTQSSWSNPLSRMERTGRTMLGRWGETEDVAKACLFLASDASSYITGSDVYVDGGWSSRGL